MRAWFVGTEPGVGSLKFEESTQPPSQPDTMVVEIHAAALNFSDLLMIDDKYQVKPTRPFIPGQEVAGIVLESGKSSGFKPGDRVTSKVDWGGFAEIANVRSDMAIKIPDELDFGTAAVLPVVYTTSMIALHHSSTVKPSDTVVVHGASGGVGLSTVEVAKAAGATVIAAAGDPSKLEVALSHGADYGVNYRSEDWVDKVKEATNGRGADIIVDPVGGKITTDSLRCISISGTLLIVGFASGTISQLPANRLLLKRASAKGVLWSHDNPSELPVIRRLTKDLMKLLENGLINPVVNDSYTLSELPIALNDLRDRSSRGKIVLRVK